MAAGVELDVAALRAATPGCEQVVHLNNAGAALMAQPVLDAVIGVIDLEARLGGYEAAAQLDDAVDKVRVDTAALLGAAPADIAWAPSDTAGWTKAFWGLALGGWFDRGGRVLVDRAAYSSHYLSLLQLRERHGVTIEVIASSEDGSLDIDDLDRLLDDDVRLVSATHIGTHRGLVNPVIEVGMRTAGTNVPFFLDACQSVGQLPVDVEAIGCDVLTGTGRKWLRGPRATGLLYVRPEWSGLMSPPGIDGHSADWVDADTYVLAPGARRFEEFESSMANRIGFGVAVEQALGLGIEALSARIGALAERARAGLAAVGATVLDGGTTRSGIVTFLAGDRPPLEVQGALAAHGVNVAVSTAPWARLDQDPRGLREVVRASPHAYNLEAEVDLLVELVGALS